MLSEDCLNILEPYRTNNDIENYTLYTYKPFNSSNLNYNDEIRIPVQNRNIVCVPHLSFLYLKGKVENFDPTKASFDWNGLAHLFSSIHYDLNAYTIDRAVNVGAISTLKLFLFSNLLEQNYATSIGFSTTDTYIDNYNETSKELQIYIPLRVLLGFFEDYKKAFVNCIHELVLLRAKDDSNVFYSDDKTDFEAGKAPKITLTEVSWKLPQLELSDEAHVRYLNIIKRNSEILLPFRAWDMYEYPAVPQATAFSWALKTTTSLLKPRFVIVYFQTDRKSNYKLPIGAYDSVKLESFQLLLNETRYPYELPRVNIDQKRYSLLYENFVNFYSSYFRRPLHCSTFEMKKFLNNIPMIVIDCSRQPDNINLHSPNTSLNGGPLNIRLDFKFHANVPDKTVANWVIVYDRLFSYKAMDGIVRPIL